MADEIDVLAIGRACVDEILEVDAYPAEDRKVSLRERFREGGGQASTAACLASHLGGRAAFLGVLGDDEPGRFARVRMEAFGVDVTGVATRGATPLAYCVVSRKTGTRTILYEASDARPLSWDEVELSLLYRARAVLVDPQGASLLPKLLSWSRARGTRVVADAEHAPIGWESTWGRVDVLAVSQTFLHEAAPECETGAALRRVAERAEGWCAATLGSDGAMAILDGEFLHIPALRVAVRDTTGAGDAFHGALCLALARPLCAVDSLRYAVAAASLSCRGLGGRSFPAPAEVDELWPKLRVRRAR